ncbi:YbhB/YbcL family Raf kinase inhibitor-like protein [Lysobacter solisilvae (ex Woo and Kim 2020)]|uniref:YbhB/YbcL family Raf kinase inhibitor-like protein n=1 Tax=Agrilutibacter terrestris TaxID=2865112 RepID=A0A7H0G0W5_9GAMM|nr:YbhB/YbcL family Raf kinase inhibitor-like protein [Lysobacter terrestris]QNP41931.1 YbhB/YbcL family Raf kinase inhibitor-like protein [Lysobacter terrestris]
MQIHSDSFEHRQRIPAEFAAGQPTADGYGFAPNRNPHLAWRDVPAGTQSFALLCIDPDVPTDISPAQIPVAQPRTEFTHWVIVDIPAGVHEFAAGSCSDGVVAHGKAAPAGPAGSRQGLNDYTGWFANDPAMRGDWRGYDGPFPPPHDLRLHRYFFRVFALDVARLDLPARFSTGEVLHAMQGHVLGEASIYGTYALNPVVAD